MITGGTARTDTFTLIDATANRMGDIRPTPTQHISRDAIAEHPDTLPPITMVEQAAIDVDANVNLTEYTRSDAT